MDNIHLLDCGLLAEKTAACSGHETTGGANQGKNCGRILGGTATATGHGTPLSMGNRCKGTESDCQKRDFELHKFLESGDTGKGNGLKIYLSMEN